MKASMKGRRAVVLGGGIAGLGAAGVLSRHFEEVKVVEQDAYPEAPGVRPHAAQGAHVHVLLAKGLEVFSQLVPELPVWLDEMGLLESDLTYDVRMAYGGGWLPRVRSGVAFRPCTRPEVEHLLRRDVGRKENVEVLSEHRAEALLGSDRARGVRVSHGGETREIEADLVVDATGRAATSARWLREAGIPAVPEETLDAGVVYSSCFYESPTDLGDDWTFMAASCKIPDQPTMAAVMRMGDRRVLSAVIGYGKPRAPRSPEEQVERAGHVGVGEIRGLLAACKPLSDVAVFANTANRWRHYGRVPRLPDGLVCIGDAVCSMNPRYGQGMTAAAMSIERLDSALASYFQENGGLSGFGLHFQRELEEVLKVPWQMALMEDRLWTTVQSGRSPGLAERVIMKGMERVLGTVFSDIDAYIQFMRVAHLMDAPTKLLAPRLLRAFATGGKSAGRGDPPRIPLAA